ncbi:hypothetical protein PMI37_03953 [Pseudomonas sp. GM80]|nr:hypothetical protein PMI37_03953 [Pseudomonas sp. GM80]
MCDECFKARVKKACSEASINELQLATMALDNNATNFLNVPYNYQEINCPSPVLPTAKTSQKDRGRRYNASKKNANEELVARRTNLSQQLFSDMPEAKLGEYLMENNLDKDDRDLDRICRLLVAGPLSTQVCVAACWSPSYWEEPPTIIFSTNHCEGESDSTNDELKKLILAFFKTEHAKIHIEDKDAAKASHKARLVGEYTLTLKNFMKARDLAKLNRPDKRAMTALLEGRFEVINTNDKNVHAELRVLEHLEWKTRKNAPAESDIKTTPIYIGVSLLCCSKCAAFLYLYRNCDRKLFLPTTRGRHGVMDAGWNAPQLLGQLINKEALIANIIHSAYSSAQVITRKHMTADLSDSEPDDY